MKSVLTLILGLAVTGVIAVPSTEARPGWCNRAALPAEKAICANGELWGLDSTLNTAYHRALADSPRQSYSIRQAQRAWLRARNGCGYNVTCIRTRYFEQIGYLESFFYN